MKIRSFKRNNDIILEVGDIAFFKKYGKIISTYMCMDPDTKTGIEMQYKTDKGYSIYQELKLNRNSCKINIHK